MTSNTKTIQFSFGNTLLVGVSSLLRVGLIAPLLLAIVFVAATNNRIEQPQAAAGIDKGLDTILSFSPITPTPSSVFDAGDLLLVQLILSTILSAALLLGKPSAMLRGAADSLQ
jgi:hypothetical protein